MPLNIDWQQILLHLFNVALLFAILYFLLYKPVHKFMDERAEKYEKMKNDTENRLAEAEKTKAEYEKQLAEANAEIDELKAQARRDMAKAADASRENAEKEAKDIISAARTGAESEKKKIIDEARGELTDLIAGAAEKLVSESTAAAYDEFLSAAEESGTDE